MGTEIIHNNNVTGLECRYKKLLNIGEEAFAVDGAVKHAWCGDMVMPERGKERHGHPVATGGFVQQRLASFTPAMGRCHIGLGPGLINEDKARGIKATLILLPLLAPVSDVGPVLLAGEHGFF